MTTSPPLRSTASPMLVQSNILRGEDRVVHAFGTRLGGVSQPPFATLNLGQSVGDDPEAVLENRRRFFGALGVRLSQVVRVWQVHGNDVLHVDEALVRREGFPHSLIDERDGHDALITNLTGLALVVSTADCLPILIHDPVHVAVAAVHAGWRGTARRVAGAAIRTLGSAYGTKPTDCRAAIGPGIRGCCYEVDAPVTELMEQNGVRWQDHATPSGPGRWRMDLARINRSILREAGLVPERIEDVGLCTACRKDLFFSHRAEGGRTGRMMNCILLRG